MHNLAIKPFVECSLGKVKLIFFEPVAMWSDTSRIFSCLVQWRKSSEGLPNDVISSLFDVEIILEDATDNAVKTTYKLSSLSRAQSYTLSKMI